MAGRDYRFLKSTLGNVAGSDLLQNEKDRLERGVEYRFLTGIVTDVISNPYEFLRSKITNDQGDEATVGEVLSGRKKLEGINLGIKNKELVETAPINSIFAKIIDAGNNSKDGALPVVCYPFFPPHLSLPLKPGEYVWLIEADMRGSKLYYWMCRQVGSIHVDDLNFTHIERIPSTNIILDEFIKSAGARDLSDDLLSLGSVLNKGEDEFTNLDTTFSDLFSNSYAYRGEFTGEPVPRMAKDCSDLLLQGSNNSGIHLTTEKFSLPEEVNADPVKFTGKLTASDTLPARKSDMSAIDIFVKRKLEDLNQLTDVSTEKLNKINTVKNSSDDDLYAYIENDKLAHIRYKDDTVFDKELLDDKSDATDIGARIYLSHNCDVDNVFESNFNVLSAHQGPSIITYAKYNRVVGLSNVRLASKVGQSFIDMDESGNIVAKSSINGGQQFLSLASTGTTRLQAKNKIELAVRGDNNVPDEPYVLYSELQKVLSDIISDIVGLNTSVQTIGEVLSAAASALPPVDAAYTSAVEVGNAALSAVGATGLFADQAKINVGNITTELSPAGRVGSGNDNLSRGSIASTKIFGE